MWQIDEAARPGVKPSLRRRVRLTLSGFFPVPCLSRKSHLSPSPGPHFTARPTVAQPPSLHDLAALQATRTSGFPDPKGRSLSGSHLLSGDPAGWATAVSPPLPPLQLSPVYNPAYEYSFQQCPPGPSTGTGTMAVTDSSPCGSHTPRGESHSHEAAAQIHVRLQQ